MKRKLSLALAFVLAVTVVMLLSSTATAKDYEGWDEICPALIDGYGDEFVVDDEYNIDFGEGTEFKKVKSAANWVASYMTYVPDPDPPGDVWTSSDQSFEELTGDCEDFAILLCALMRFNIEVPENRVWVSINLVTEPGAGVVAAHAWVGYKLERGGMAYIEPQTGNLYRGRPKGMLNFNDQWVKGGGRWLAGPRK
jgi:hypothetical protein